MHVCSKPAQNRIDGSEPLSLLIVGPPGVCTLVEQEFKKWPWPDFNLAAFSEPVKAIRFLRATESSAIHLAILPLTVAQSVEGQEVLQTLRTYFPKCPAILTCSPSRRPTKPLAGAKRTRLLEEPIDAADLISTAAELLCGNSGALSRERHLKKRAIEMVNERLAELRAERFRIGQQIHALTAEPATVRESNSVQERNLVL